MLSPDQPNKKISIQMNNDDLDPFDPFNLRNNATQELPAQTISIQGESILVQPYVLPHHNKASAQEYTRYAGDEGYLHNQGFYIYRNRRLIIKGSWFRLIKKEELNKLIRVKVDIPNTLDHLWKLDVKKSYASPPEAVRQELQKVIRRIEGAGRRVYRQRGVMLASAVSSPVWRRVAVNGTILYEVNREHPLIVEMLDKVEVEYRSQLQQMIKMIENSFPVDIFFNDFAQNPRDVATPNWDDQEFEQLADIFVSSYLEAGISEGGIAEKLLSIDPFAANRERTLRVLSRKGYTL